MLIKFVHENGKEYTIPVSQVVAMTNDGRPVAITHETNGSIVHCDATKSDFGKTCKRLRLEAPQVDLLDAIPEI